MSKNYPGLWMALHRPNGTELVEQDAPGYRRTPYSMVDGGRFAQAQGGWGAVAFGSVWTAPTGGKVVSWPILQPLVFLLGASS
jgi:hypothetical protein